MAGRLQVLQEEQAARAIVGEAHQFCQGGTAAGFRRLKESVDADPLRDARAFDEMKGFELVQSNSNLGLVVAGQGRDLGGGAKTGGVAVEEGQDVPLTQVSHPERFQALSNSYNVVAFFRHHYANFILVLSRAELENCRLLFDVDCLVLFELLPVGVTGGARWRFLPHASWAQMDELPADRSLWSRLGNSADTGP